MDASAAGLDPAALERFERAVLGDIAAGKHHGASVIIARDGVVGFAKAFGVVDPETDRPARLRDRYLLMSLTKSLTAALVLQQVDRGLLGFDTRVGEVVPEFAQRGKQRITVRHLLTHTAGVYSGFEGPNNMANTLEAGNLPVAIHALAGWPPLHRPGARVIYTPWEGFALLGEVARRVDPQQRRFRDLMREEIFAPLGMADTSIGLPVDHPDRVPVAVTGVRGGQAQAASLFDALNEADENWELPAGGAFSTASDVLTFAETIRLGGTNGTTRLMSPAIVDYAYRNHTGDLQNEFWDFNKEAADLADFPANFSLGGGYVRGTGHYLTPLGQMASPAAYGAVGSGSTSWLVDPERGLTVVFLAAGLMQGLAHFQRLQRLNDLALAAVV